MALSRNLAYNTIMALALLMVPKTSISQDTKALQPSIMIFPSDNLLKTLNCLQVVNNHEETTYIRNYQKAFINDSELGFIISSIQERFVEIGFPLRDLEQTLKDMNNPDSDTRSKLLSVAKPDIIIELNYALEKRGIVCELFITLRALDAYTLKTFATAQNPGIESINCNAKDALSKQVEMNIYDFQTLISYHFEDIKKNGREITIEIHVENNAVYDLRIDKCGTNYSYSKWVQDWIRNRSIGNTGKKVQNNQKILEFIDVRIPLFDSKGLPIAASDWAYDLAQAIMDSCNIVAFDNSQGLGRAVIVLIP